MAELVLVLGGARSGKSLFAERLAETFGPRVLYIATAEPGDAEMVERVRQHQARRPPAWQTHEAPLDLPAGRQLAKDPYDAILLDCLTLWASNHLLAAVEPGEEPSLETAAGAEATLRAALDDFISWQSGTASRLIIVSNEVGQGLVPPYPLGRVFRDLLGRLNQRVAADADRVYYLFAGLALELKGLGASPFPPGRP